MDQHTELEKYRGEYTESSFWSKVKKTALAAGRELIEKALWLYYAIIDSDTPTKAKLIIAGALGYFISPIDIIPDFIPVLGWVDDIILVPMMVSWIVSRLPVKVRADHRERNDRTIDGRARRV